MRYPHEQVFQCPVCRDWQVDTLGLPLYGAVFEEPGAHVASDADGIAYQPLEVHMVPSIWNHQLEGALHEHLQTHVVQLTLFFTRVDRLTEGGETATLRRELRLALSEARKGQS